MLIVAVVFTCARYASASTVTTVKPGDVVLRTTDNKDALPPPANRFKTLDECVKASNEGQFKCDQSNLVTKVSTCADEKAPRIYLSLVDLQDGNGTKGWELPEMETPTLKAGSDSEYLPERDWLYVRNPKGDAAYPTCWVRGWEDPNLWRANPKADPGKVFMERIEPGMTAADIEMPNDETPDDEWTPAMKATWKASCVERQGSPNTIYPDDPPCPPT